MSVPFFCDTDVFLILYSKGLFVFMQRNLSKSRGKKTYFLILYLHVCFYLIDCMILLALGLLIRIYQNHA